MFRFKIPTRSYKLKNNCARKIAYTAIVLFVNTIGLNAQDRPHTPLIKLDTVFKDLKNQLQKATTSKNTKAIVNAHLDLAHFYEHLGIENEAIKNYHSALELHDHLDTTTVYIGNKIGAIHLSLKQYKNALQYVNKSLNIANQIQFKKGKATSYALLGSVAEKNSDYTLALQHQEQSLALFKTLQDSTGLAITYENIGSIYEDLEHFENALIYFNKANKYTNHVPNNNKINIINNIGDAHRKQGNPKAALPYTQLALQMAKSTNNTHQIEAALKDIALIYADLNDYKTAFNYMIAFKDLNASESQYKNAELVSILQILYEVEEREAEVKLLNKQHELNQVRQRIILLSSTFVILILAGWFLYFRKRKKQEVKIQDYKNQLLQSNLEKKTNEEAALQREIEFKISALTNYSLHLSHKNKMISDISRTLANIKDRNTTLIKSKLETLIKEIDLDISQEEEWTGFISFFEQIHPNFFHTLKTIVTKELSPSELRLCMLLRLNLSSKDIASILRITPDSVRIARYRLRKKLPIDSKEDLQLFILNL
ncbi:tetratricopeptide repeat protein [Formosa sediminum]|uniref:Tetratricopeptide repeat protein n=1 Tax=Formosa sediminum TaxID=2594004 RepID=A0A516GPK0_9FLAO|nr:tetratricopeptide repeat protein [Formosa sediminum]QDO93454.1 tetratricopeptide repeat protein [Formosa sediminum]